MVVRILYVKIILKYLCKVLVFNCFFFIKSMKLDLIEYMDIYEIILLKYIKL